MACLGLFPVRWCMGSARGRRPSKAVRQFVLRESTGRCGLCGGRALQGSLNFHHIRFFRDGGASEPENLLPLHADCHTFLHQLPEEMAVVLAADRKRDLGQLFSLRQHFTELVQSGERDEIIQPCFSKVADRLLRWSRFDEVIYLEALWKNRESGGIRSYTARNIADLACGTAYRYRGEYLAASQRLEPILARGQGTPSWHEAAFQNAMLSGARDTRPEKRLALSNTPMVTRGEIAKIEGLESLRENLYSLRHPGFRARCSGFLAKALAKVGDPEAGRRYVISAPLSPAILRRESRDVIEVGIGLTDLAIARSTRDPSHLHESLGHLRKSASGSLSDLHVRGISHRFREIGICLALLEEWETALALIEYGQQLGKKINDPYINEADHVKESLITNDVTKYEQLEMHVSLHGGRILRAFLLSHDN